MRTSTRRPQWAATRLACAAALLLAPALVRAEHSVGAEVGLGSMTLPGSTAANSYTSFSAFGTAELVQDRLLLDLNYGLLSPSDAHASHLASLGLEYLPSDHWTFSLTFYGSPSREDVTIRDYPRESLAQLLPTIATGQGTILGRLTEGTSQLGGELTAGYDTAGFGALEGSFDLSLGLSSLTRAEELRVRQQELTTKFDENSIIVGAGATAILWQDTDVFLRGYFYGYGRSAQMTSKTALLATATESRVVDFMQDNGLGLTLAPLRSEWRLGATHRFGRILSASLQLGSGHYEEGGSTGLVRLKLTGRPIASLRIYGSATIQRDRIPALSADPIPSRYASVGAEWEW